MVVGLVFSAGVLSLDYSRWKRYARAVYFLSLGLLALVLFHAPTIFGAGRWLLVGSIQIQPSELAKLAVIIMLAKFLSDHEGEDPSYIMWISLLYLAFPIGLVLLQPDLGTALVFIGILFGMLFVAGVPGKRLLIMAGVGLALFVVAVFLSTQGWLEIFKDYQLKRLLIFINPYRDPTGDGWNVIQSMIAIGSGGFFGKGLFSGTQTQLDFVPARHTDFIFSVIGEELGFLGGIALLVCYWFLLLRGIHLLSRAKDKFGALLIAGVLSMIFFHVFINVGMALGMMPVTGLPLPFASVGGTSLAASMMGVAIVLSVYMRRQKILF